MRGLVVGRDGQVQALGHAGPHALEELDGAFLVDAAFGQVLLVVGPEKLVHAAVGGVGADLLLQAGKSLGEPVGLDGFMEGARRVLGHPFTVGSDGQQLLLAAGIGLFGGLATGQFRMAAGPGDDTFTDGDDGFQVGTLFALVHRIVGIQFGHAGQGFFTDALEAQLEQAFPVQAPLQAGTVRGRFAADVAGDVAALVGIGQTMGLGIQTAVQILVEGLVLPVGVMISSTARASSALTSKGEASWPGSSLRADA